MGTWLLSMIPDTLQISTPLFSFVSKSTACQMGTWLLSVIPDTLQISASFLFLSTDVLVVNTSFA